MRWFRRLRARLKYRTFDADLREEIDAHRAMKARDLRASGTPPDRAVSDARKALGNVTLARESARRVWIAPWLESVGQDVRYAARSLRRSPGYLLTSVLTLGLGLGLNVSLFTMFNVMALQAWDVRDPASIRLPFSRPVGTRPATDWMSLAEYEYLRDEAKTVAGLVARQRGSGRVHPSPGSDEFVYVQMYGVSGNFFDVLGIGLAAGRGLSPADDAASAPPAAVISHRLWRHAFGGERDVVGRTVGIGVNREPVTIVGVARRGFAGVDPILQVDVFVPLALFGRVDPSPRGERPPLERSVAVAARLRSGTTAAEAEAELDGLSRQFRASVPLEGNGLVLTGTRPIQQPGQLTESGPLLLAFGAAVLLVLILACANIGNLQLARALARGRELAVRLSLGAARARVVRQQLTEAMCVSTAAAGLAVLLAWFLPSVIVRLQGPATDALAFRPDGLVVAFAVGLAIASSLAFALAPALRATRLGVALAARARMQVDLRGRRLRGLLLGVQLAVSLVLLAGASLLTRGIAHVQMADLGFDWQQTTAARLTVPADLRTKARIDALVPALDAALRSSKVWPVGWTMAEPLNQSRYIVDVRRPEETAAWNRRALEREMTAVTFDVLRLDLIAGRPYDDRPEAREAVINQTLARLVFGGENALGRTILAEDVPYTVTGVVRDSYFTTPTDVEPLFHRAPDFSALPRLIFRSDRPGAVEELHAVIAGVDDRIDLTTWPVQANIERTLEDRKLAANVAWAIGALGLALATIGVFGVFAYVVEERRREIGIRVALGASARNVARALFAVNRWSVGGGLIAGLVLSVLGGFTLRSYLFGLSPLDPAAYAIVIALLLVAAALATVVPSRRAMRVDPAVTLRAE